MGLNIDLYRDDVIAYFVSHIPCDGFVLETLFFTSPQKRSVRLNMMIERQQIKRKLISYKLHEKRHRRYFYYADELSIAPFSFNFLGLSYAYVLKHYGTITRFEPEFIVHKVKDVIVGTSLSARCIVDTNSETKTFYIEIEPEPLIFEKKLKKYENLYTQEPFEILYISKYEHRYDTHIPIRFITIGEVKSAEYNHLWTNDDNLNGQTDLNESQIAYLDQIVNSLRPTSISNVFENFKPFRIYKFNMVYPRPKHIIEHIIAPVYVNPQLIVDVDTKEEIIERFKEYSYTKASIIDGELHLEYYAATYHKNRIDRITDTLNIIKGKINRKIISKSKCMIEVMQDEEVVKRFIKFYDLLTYLKQNEGANLSVKICGMPIPLKAIKEYE